MTEEIKILFEDGQGSIEEKKSKFIANTHVIESEEEALEFIEKIKKKYWDARHNCFAYTLGDRHQIQRCSDDGEPSGTAGRPMLEVLLGEDIHNCIVVVTRYFGGTLLGTGGLVRAYQQSTKEGLANSVILKKKSGKKIIIKTDYNGIGKIQYILRQNKCPELEVEYTDVVTIHTVILSEIVDTVISQITEATSGKAQMESSNEIYFGDANGRILFFN